MPRSRAGSVRHVAVLIDLSLGYRRGLFEGFARYSREQRRWILYFELRGLEPFPPWLRDWRGDGILACFPPGKLAQVIRATGAPVVDLWGGLTPSRLPLVSTDNAEVARLAVEHFWERGIRHFGFCGLPSGDRPYVDQRAEAFRQRVQAAGCPCSLFALPAQHGAVSDWERQVEQLAAWLQTLPKPVGVLAHDDERGYQVLNVCRRAGLAVPEEVAVCGVGNDTVLCEMCVPPLSSIDLNAPRIGYNAAACLDRLMHGRQPLRSWRIVQPQQLVARHSTDLLATGDSDLAAALRFIRDHACDGIRLDDVLRQVAVSQRSLERKFHSFLGRTPKAELLRVQMAQADYLLTHSGLPIKEVAQRCGFQNNEMYFSNAFYRQHGLWPTAYRRRYRNDGGFV